MFKLLSFFTFLTAINYNTTYERAVNKLTEQKNNQYSANPELPCVLRSFPGRSRGRNLLSTPRVESTEGFFLFAGADSAEYSD